MSFQAMAWAVKQKVGNATGKAILLMLANYADDGGECFPSQERLANECECSVATVARWIKHFEDSGILTRYKQYGEGGYRRADRLRLVMDLPVKELPSKELPNSESNLTHHRVVAEPINEPINPSSLRSEGKRTAAQFDELIKVLDAEHAKAVIEHRKHFKAKFSPYAAKLLAGKFAKCPDPNAAADAMIANGWQGFEPEWLERRQPRGSPSRRPPSLADAMLALSEGLTNGQDGNRTGNESDWGDAAGFPRLIEHQR